MPDMNSADMKKHLSDPAKGHILFHGKLITSVNDVPKDDEIQARRKQIEEEIAKRR